MAKAPAATKGRSWRLRWSVGVLALTVGVGAMLWLGRDPPPERERAPWFHGLYELEWGERLLPLASACTAPEPEQFTGLATAEEFRALAEALFKDAELDIEHEVDCSELPCLMYVPWADHGSEFHAHMDALAGAVARFDAEGRLGGGHMIVRFIEGSHETLPWLVPRPEDIMSYEGEFQRRGYSGVVVAWIPDDAGEAVLARLWWRIEQRVLAGAGIDPHATPVRLQHDSFKDVLSQRSNPPPWPMVVPVHGEIHFEPGGMTGHVVGAAALLGQGCTPAAWPSEEAREEQRARFETTVRETLGNSTVARVDCREPPCIIFLEVDDPRPAPTMLDAALGLEAREPLFHHTRASLPDGRYRSLVGLAWLPESPERPPDAASEARRARTLLRMQSAGVDRVNAWLEGVEPPPEAAETDPNKDQYPSGHGSTASPWDPSRLPRKRE